VATIVTIIIPNPRYDALAAVRLCKFYCDQNVSNDCGACATLRIIALVEPPRGKVDNDRDHEAKAWVESQHQHRSAASTNYTTSRSDGTSLSLS
jgi:predicted transcriptional regulator